MLAALIDGMNESGAIGGAGAGRSARLATATTRPRTAATGQPQRRPTWPSLLGLIEMCWGDVGLLLSMPRQGLGHAAIAAVANDEQLERFGGKWAAMAITEPEAGSDSAAIRTTAKLDEDGDEYVLNGEKIYVTSGERAELIVVWATLDRSAGPRRDQVASWSSATTPASSSTGSSTSSGSAPPTPPTSSSSDCRVPKENLLGAPRSTPKEGFAGVDADLRQHPPAGGRDGGRRAPGPAWSAPASILAEAGIEIDYDRPRRTARRAAAAEFIAMEADWEAARLLTLQAAWMADNRKPNSMQASMAKAKAGRMGTDVALRCVALCGAIGYGEGELLEKWARDAKILDIFEGTQQIQLLIVARRLLGLSSAQLR